MSEFDGVSETSFTALPDHDANSYYEIRLTATDSDGLTGSRTITIRPETVKMTLESTPPGADVSYAGFAGTTPLTRTTAIGFETTVTATERFARAARRTCSTTGRTARPLARPACARRRYDLRAHYLADANPLVELAHDRPATASAGSRPCSPRATPSTATPPHGGRRRCRRPLWQVDLGAAREIGRVELDWAVPYSSSYRILTSTDGTDFTEAATDAATGTGLRSTSFVTRSAR